MQHASMEPKPVDPKILQKLSASVSHFHGPRKNLSYVVSVETTIPGRRSLRDERESCQLVSRTFDDFRRFRKSLLARVSGKPSAGRCACEGENCCAFDSTRTFLERLRFTRMPFLGLSNAEADLNKRQLEMNNFLRVIFAILHRMQPSAWHPECLFLQDVLTFLAVEETFFEQIEALLKHKQQRLMNLDGWKAHTLETYGAGISV